jgi:hypothetical protein
MFSDGHEVDTLLDWTLCPNNRTVELLLRDKRNDIIKMRLRSGEKVSYRSSGWSLYPMVNSGDECFYDPVTEPEEVKVQDIVFCQVQPTLRFHAHIVKEKIEKWVNGEDYTQGVSVTFKISNLHGYVNGWCTMETIYGKLVQIKQ